MKLLTYIRITREEAKNKKKHPMIHQTMASGFRVTTKDIKDMCVFATTAHAWFFPLKISSL